MFSGNAKNLAKRRKWGTKRKCGNVVSICLFFLFVFLFSRVPSSDEMNASQTASKQRPAAPAPAAAAAAAAAVVEAPVAAPENGVATPADVEAGPSEAIYVRHAFKSYGMGKKRAHVLRNLDMNVKRGTMYVTRFRLAFHLFLPSFT